MRAVDIIQKKKRGGALSPDEIRFMISGFCSGAVADYQMSAFAMAICFSGMNDEETAALTDAMMRSGDMLDLSPLGDLTADKHSTGGVGDKTSLIVAPTVASLGVTVAKMSGRGLGHTGGTIDKLESIVGFRTTMSGEEFFDIARRVGVVIAGQSANLAPADKKLYALRDVTATVDSIPLIASSIMSKKLAAGARSIVLDVKCGSGAFMKDVSSARELSRAMVSIGKACGRRVRAVISDMDVPLGRAVGNSLEVIEAAELLKNDVYDDLRDICVALAANMVSMAKGIPLAEAESAVNGAISSGEAFRKMKEWVAAQGGRAELLDDTSRFPTAPVVREITADSDGYIFRMDAEMIGNASSILGAGRLKKEDAIDYTAGIEIFKKTGDLVSRGDVIAMLYTSDEGRIDDARRTYLSALTLSPEPPKSAGLILGTVE